jgi:hypothetical protein
MSKKDKRWAIAVTAEKWETYKNTLKALGFNPYEEEYHFDYSHIVDSDSRPSGFCQGRGSAVATRQVFENLEDFLLWWWAPEKTERELKIEALKETIKKAQEQLDELT